MEVTIGGDRLGAGNKMTQEMHEYNRSSFNQEQDFKSSLAPGILYPFLCIPMTNGDSMDIDLDTFVRTLPTKGPLFGSFKLQCDIFSVPMRLYNGTLHNNPTKIGMNMSQIYMPKLELEYTKGSPIVKGLTKYDWQIHPTSLLKYLGFSGIGQLKDNFSKGDIARRKINAIPILGYYDIFKNYYANKQEENAYIITPGNIASLQFDSVWADQQGHEQLEEGVDYTWTQLGYNSQSEPVVMPHIYIAVDKHYEEEDPYTFYDDYVIFSFDSGETWLKGSEAMQQDLAKPVPVIGQSAGIKWEFTNKAITNYSRAQFKEGQPITEGDITLQSFPLDNIDKMRELILQKTDIGYEFKLNEWNDAFQGLPYDTLYTTTEVGTNYNSFAENGLVVKTYQSDLFNNWIDTEWIEGDNGIAALSAVAIQDNALQIDALILGQKVYNMLNRVALAGGTYEDWQDAVYTQGAVRKAETPMYEGGMSAEIMFEEVISNAETMVDGDFQALGTLGGKGTQVSKKGGNNIHVHSKEPIFVMGIVSITPRICYTQGNEWYLTELNTFNDLHKPALDGIGFQDLITEQMAWFGTGLVYNGGVSGMKRTSAGKTVAWANYMTAVDKAYGDFARPQGKGFMVLARNYEIDEENECIKDVTTYIDPTKFNYAFAYTNLDAQNFWVQIHSKIVTRRVMSAHQIPNL